MKTTATVIYFTSHVLCARLVPDGLTIILWFWLANAVLMEKLWRDAKCEFVGVTWWWESFDTPASDDKNKPHKRLVS